MHERRREQRVEMRLDVGLVRAQRRARRAEPFRQIGRDRRRVLSFESSCCTPTKGLRAPRACAYLPGVPSSGFCDWSRRHQRRGLRVLRPSGGGRSRAKTDAANGAGLEAGAVVVDVETEATVLESETYLLRINCLSQFRILFLDKRNQLIADEVQQQGTIDHTPVYPREVVKRALELSATAIILVHNHPSGDPTPSSADIEMTKQIANVAKPLGVQLYDHIIVGKDGHASLKGLRLI